jgi:small conductance mechanosensitive channel
MPQLASTWDEIEAWLKANGTDVLIILAVALIVRYLFRRVFPHVARAAIMRGAHPPDEEMSRRANTIISVLEHGFDLLLGIIVTVTILTEFGIDVTALVAGLGITGLALAMGSQQFVRDAINGIFLMAEDQYRQGDVVTIAGVTGTVEMITLRRTVIRDNDGVVYSVPNGSITVVSNHTRDYAVVNVQVRVAVGEDMERVRRAIQEAGREMGAAPGFSDLLTEAPSGYRVESIDENGTTITVSARAKPAARWDVAADLRQRLSDAFLRNGIRVPYPVLSEDEAAQPAGQASQPGA